ncbi:hypothetical protein GF391_00880, partial [Candidatus Uhrbacteria bacterium]|nr:hypothetical protein [Candidatus Uhrbacteria bacterium]
MRMIELSGVIYKRRQNAVLAGWAIAVAVILLMLGGVSYISYTGMSGSFSELEIINRYAANASVYLWLMPAALFALIIFFLTIYSLGSKKTFVIEDDALRFDGRRIDLRSRRLRIGKWNIQHAGN